MARKRNNGPSGDLGPVSEGHEPHKHEWTALACTVALSASGHLHVHVKGNGPRPVQARAADGVCYRVDCCGDLAEVLATYDGHAPALDIGELLAAGVVSVEPRDEPAPRQPEAPALTETPTTE
jgi:hypothetical protein